MKLNPRWGRLARAVKRWWRNEPSLDRSFLNEAVKLLTDYHESYASRAGVMSDHARQAAEIVEREGRKRAPSMESEVRILALAVEKLLLLHIDHTEEP